MKRLYKIAVISLTTLLMATLCSCRQNADSVPPTSNSPSSDVSAPGSPPEDIAEIDPSSTPLVSYRFEVSKELEAFTQTVGDTYFSKYGRHLFSEERWWLDYGTDKDSVSGKELHQYIYLEDKRSYLDPNITVITDEDSGSIISVSVAWSSTERFTEQAAQVFTEFFNCVATVFMPNISEGHLDKLLNDLCESENWIEHHSEPYPTTVYFTDNMYCYAYFKDGSETIYFGTDVLEKLPEYASNNVNCIEIEQENTLKTEVDLSPYFDGSSGAAVFLDKSGNYTVYNKAVSELRISPCSTFKIISTLAAFEYDAITPSQSVIAWDGTKWKNESWNKDLTITEAFQNSCVWYYRKLIDKIGQENMTNFIETLDYGNCETSQWEGSSFNKNSLIDGFWLESSLLISPQEQVDVLYRIFEGTTEIDKNDISELKKMMYKEDTNNNFKIYGKTGRGRGAWFVGFFEANGDNTYFAVYLNEQEGINSSKAQEIASNIIQGYFFKTIS